MKLSKRAALSLVLWRMGAKVRVFREVRGYMNIYIDADSCPKEARALLLRAAVKRKIPTIFAANREIPDVVSATGDYVAMEVCPPGDNSADNFIADTANPGDIVITRDIPLCSRLVEKGIFVLDDRGKAYTKENIKESLSIRDFVVGLADNGMDIERTKNYGKKELKNFADSLDKAIVKIRR